MPEAAAPVRPARPPVRARTKEYRCTRCGKMFFTARAVRELTLLCRRCKTLNRFDS
jgi:predicted SprT family Zn-dependent metalloprotease